MKWTVAALLVISTALFAPVDSVLVVPPNVTVPLTLLSRSMPRPPSSRVIELLVSKSIEPGDDRPLILATLPPGLVMSTSFRSMTALTLLLPGVAWSPSTMKAWLVAPFAVSIET